MGFRVSFVVSQSSPDDLLEALGFSVLDAGGTMPEDGRWCAKLSNTGWTVLFAYDFELPAEVQDALSVLSEYAPQYAGIVSETNMACALSRFQDGKEQWAIDWYGEQGFNVENLQARGSLPEKYEKLKKDAIEAQALDTEVDYLFDIAALLLKDETGFRYDDWLETNDVDQFRIVSRTPKAKSKNSILSKLFGRR